MEKTTYYVKKVIQVPDGNGRLVEHEIFISVPYEDVIREIGDYVTPRIRGQKVAQICAEDDSEENSEGSIPGENGGFRGENRVTFQSPGCMRGFSGEHFEPRREIFPMFPRNIRNFL
ncbi:hypothetical protein Fcan01_26755 [Folsomia candida]|uniref:Uncharacterized protein n=1 Tax=Folsomia candida TaxID=158441 RepID=A0A226D065_FOLCA|nr:hypothetical protein Fcan01_26755 [Folsomia candida]